MPANFFVHFSRPLRSSFFVGLLALAGCGGTPFKMAELKPVTPQIKLDRLLNTEVGETEATVLRPAGWKDAIYTADSKGRVRRMAKPGAHDVTWKRGLKASLLGGIAANDLMVVVTAVKGQVIALNAQTGETLWENNVGAEITSPALITEEVVVVKSNAGSVVGINRGDGKTRWTYRYTRPPLIVQSYAPAVSISQSRIVLGLPAGHLLSLEADSGKVLWDVEISPPLGATELERVNDVVGDVVVLPDGASVCAVSFRGRIGCFDADNGQPMWSSDMSSPVGIDVVDKALIAVDQRGIVHAYDVNIGSPIWVQEGLLNRRPTGPLAVGSTIVMGDVEGYLHFLSIKDGSFVARVHMAVGPIIATPEKYDPGFLTLSKYGALTLYEIR